MHVQWEGSERLESWWAAAGVRNEWRERKEGSGPAPGGQSRGGSVTEGPGGASGER